MAFAQNESVTRGVRWIFGVDVHQLPVKKDQEV